MRCCLLVALALLTGGCSEQGAAQDANAPVKILTSQMYVTIRNDSGAPLNEVSVAIVPVGRQTIYNKFIGRLESSESRNVMLGDFLGRDGTPFSLRVVKQHRSNLAIATSRCALWRKRAPRAADSSASPGVV
jgi:hypothetical protein